MTYYGGLIGYGPLYKMGHYHAKTIRSVRGLDVSCVYDVVKSRAEAGAKELGCQAYHSLRSLVRHEPLDFVVVITPHDSHAQIAVQAAAEGKHVVVEKPMCMNGREAQRMIASARKHKVLLTVHQNRREDEDYVAVRKAVLREVVGRPFYLEACVGFFNQLGGWRDQKRFGGGMLLDWGAHLIDQVVQLQKARGARPTHVQANIQSVCWKVDVDTHNNVRLIFDDGLVADVQVSSAASATKPRWYVLCQRGAITKQGSHGRGPLEIHRSRGGKPQSRQVPVPDDQSGWRRFYANWLTALQGKKRPAVTPEDALLVMRIIDGAKVSSRQRRIVRL